MTSLQLSLKGIFEQGCCADIKNSQVCFNEKKNQFKVWGNNSCNFSCCSSQAPVRSDVNKSAWQNLDRLFRETFKVPLEQEFPEWKEQNRTVKLLTIDDLEKVYEYSASRLAAASRESAQETASIHIHHRSMSGQTIDIKVTTTHRGTEPFNSERIAAYVQQKVSQSAEELNIDKVVRLVVDELQPKKGGVISSQEIRDIVDRQI